MKDLNQKEIKHILLEMLINLKEILNKNEIDFFLAYGTCLGAVRHNGFIPWDDDIDIFIYGIDYDKLKKIFKEQDTGYLQLHDYSTCKNYPYTIPKIIDSRTILKEKKFEHLNYDCGIYIDIFLLSYTSDNYFYRKIINLKERIKYISLRSHYLNLSEYGIEKRVIFKILKFFTNPQAIQKSLYKFYINNRKTQYYIPSDCFSEKYTVPVKYFDQKIDILFEKIEMPIPVKYEKILKKVYGDYLVLPEIEDRVSNHSYSFIKLK